MRLLADEYIYRITLGLLRKDGIDIVSILAFERGSKTGTFTGHSSVATVSLGRLEVTAARDSPPPVPKSRTELATFAAS